MVSNTEILGISMDATYSFFSKNELGISSKHFSLYKYITDCAL